MGHWWYDMRTKGYDIEMPIQFIQFQTFILPSIPHSHTDLGHRLNWYLRLGSA